MNKIDWYDFIKRDDFGMYVSMSYTMLLNLKEKYCLLEQQFKAANSRVQELEEALKEIANGHLCEKVSESIAKQALKIERERL